MVTQTAQADVSFYFYGTGVQLYGAKRQNHGTFQISIDSVVYTPVNGSVSYPEAFQTALFTTNALKNGYHTVRMTNLESRYLDLDFVRSVQIVSISIGVLTRPLDCRLHGKPRLDKPMNLSLLRLCKIRIHHSSTPLKSSGIRARRLILECSLGGRGSTCHILGLGQTATRVPDICLCSVTSTAGASVEYTFKVSIDIALIIVGNCLPVDQGEQLWHPQSTSQLTPKRR